MTGRKSYSNLVPKIGALCALMLLPNTGCTRKVSLLDEPNQPGDIEGVPITSCSRGGLCQEMPEVVDKLDLLFVVDNSEGMAHAQQALAAQLPTFLEALASGRRLTDASGRFPAASDMHVGVVTSDMGMLAVEQLPGCAADGGDDGRLQHEPRAAACESGYPPFSSYASESATADISSLANDLACITPVGTGGCDYAQPLEAALKALTPYQYKDRDGLPYGSLEFLSLDRIGTRGRGDQLGGARGFVREDALLGIIVLTDDDDTSVQDTEAFKPAMQLPRDSEYREQDPKLRAFLNPDSLAPLQRYLGGFKLLNIYHPERVMFAAIAGAPPDLVEPQTLAGLDYQNERALSEYYDGLLADERMTQQVDPATNPGSGEGKLIPSCMHPAPDGSASQPAYPPRRLAELARSFGPNGVVQSICQDDLAPAMGPIVDRLASQLGIACLEQPLQRRADGSVDCEVIWELGDRDYALKGPTVPPYTCSEREFLEPATKPRHDRNGNNCSVRQLVATDAEHLPSGEGFYYDDFTPSPENSCRDGRMTRIRFTPGVIPNGVLRVVLDCSPEAVRK